MSGIPQHSHINNATQLGPPTSRDAWRNLFTARIATLVYLKSVLSGKTPYASLVLLSQRDLHAVYDSERMRKRSHRHLLLGLALSPLLELHNIADFSKGVLNAFAQVDALPESFGSAPSAASGTSTSGPMASLGFASLSKGEGRGMVSHGTQHTLPTVIQSNTCNIPTAQPLLQQEGYKEGWHLHRPVPSRRSRRCCRCWTLRQRHTDWPIHLCKLHRRRHLLWRPAVQSRLYASLLYFGRYPHRSLQQDGFAHGKGPAANPQTTSLSSQEMASATTVHPATTTAAA